MRIEIDSREGENNLPEFFVLVNKLIKITIHYFLYYNINLLIKKLFMNLLKTDTDTIWEVIKNPDPSNIEQPCTNCCCNQSFAVKHRDGGIIRFYRGRTMTKATAEKLKQELTQQEI